MSSLFSKRPAWAQRTSDSAPKPTPSPSDTPTKHLDLFTRNPAVFDYKQDREDRKRANEERRQRKLEKKSLARKARKASDGAQVDGEESREGGDEDEDAGKSQTRPNAAESPVASSPEPVKFGDDGMPSSSPRKRRKLSAEGDITVKQSIEKDTVFEDVKSLKKSVSLERRANQRSFLLHGDSAVDAITLSDDDGNTKDPSDTAARDNSDAELERLARRAEVRKRREANNQSPSHPTNSTSTKYQPQEHPPPTAITPPTTATVASPSTSQSTKPVVTILVHSQLTSTRPLMFRVHLDQQLRSVKQAFCQRFELSADLSKEVFLRWRGFKMFDSTTCQSLGIRVDEGTGEVLWKSKGLTEMPGSANLAMEAWTKELIESEEKKKKEEKDRKKSEETVSGAQESVVKDRGEKKHGMRVTVKAKEQEDWTINVYKDTTFKRLANAYRKVKEIPPDKELFIMIDGERVAPEQTMEDMDVEDSMTVDAHVR